MGQQLNCRLVIKASLRQKMGSNPTEVEAGPIVKGQPQIQGAGGPQVQMTGEISLGNPQAVADSMRLAVGKG